MLSTLVTFLLFLRDCLCPSRSSSSSLLTAAPPSSPIRPWVDPNDVDRQKVYLLAPTPRQQWTSHYAHPQSDFSPSFQLNSAVADDRLTALLTPSKDWWTGHKTGTAENTPSALPKLDFGDMPTEVEETTTTTTVTRSSKRATRTAGSRRSTRNQESEEDQQQANEPETEERGEAENESPDSTPDESSAEPESVASEDADAGRSSSHDDSYDFASGGDDVDVYENDDAPSDLVNKRLSSGRRSSGTPSRHRRQWTHTIVPGVEEQRIHRKGGRNLF